MEELSSIQQTHRSQQQPSMPSHCCCGRGNISLLNSKRKDHLTIESKMQRTNCGSCCFISLPNCCSPDRSSLSPINSTTFYRSSKKFGEKKKRRRTLSLLSYHKLNIHQKQQQQQQRLMKSFFKYSLVLLLVLSNSLEFNKSIVGHLAQATNAQNNINIHHNNNNNKNSISSINYINDDEQASSSYFRKTKTFDNLKNQPPSDDLSDTTTQIPVDYNGDSATTTISPATTTTRRPSSQNVEKKPLLRITDNELLPFDYFNVQQPAFTDLIRVWPPTTIYNHLYGSHSSDSHLKSSRRHARQQQSLQQKQRQHHHTSGQKTTAHFLDDDDVLSEDEKLLRNHLNEDLDDTIVTADQSFDLDQLPEPPTWVNYLGDLGDYLYVQLRQYSEKQSQSSTSVDEEESSKVPKSVYKSTDNEEEQQNQKKSIMNQQLKIETIDEILDDYYYDQYENSQVLYYGTQLVREGDIVEFGCYLPSEQQAEWTKSGRPLRINKSSSPRVLRKGDFLGAKQNFSLKIFEASLSDSGNYRCSKLSRKYHKLVVVPIKTSVAQLYMIQQRLLSVVNPQLMSQTPPSTYGLPPISRFSAPTMGGSQVQRFHSATTLNQIRQFHNQSQKSTDSSYMLPGYLIVEDQPLIVNCNITDEFILRRLRENPKFSLAWFKNGRQIVNPSQALAHQQTSSYNSVMTKQQSFTTGSQLGRRSGVARQVSTTSSRPENNGSNSSFESHRIQFLQPNGRQLYITSALFSDAGEYLCSWSKLPLTRNQPTNGDVNGEETSGSDFYSSSGAVINGANEESNLIGAGNLVQLLAPVKLQPFKSTYHVRQGNQLRLICHAQRGYPSAHISWYIGNRLVDGEFLRQHPNEFRVLHLQNQNQLTVAPAILITANGSPNENDDGKRKLVEINPIPSTRHQMQLTANGRGQWIEYRDLKSEKYAIDNYEQQLRYLQMKLAQLNRQSSFRSSASDSTATSGTTINSQPGQVSGLSRQSSMSVLVINSLNVERHTSRFSCRATTRANTDEVTTVIKVQESSTITLRPSSGKATLILGQPLHFQCEVLGNPRAEFFWFKKPINLGYERIIEPGSDDNIEIHNDRLTLHKATRDSVGDYFCRALVEDKSSTDPNEFAVIKARMQPYIDDFGLDTSHTGKSSVITEGDRLELTCSVPDHSAPVNITWLRSTTPDDDRSMVRLAEVPPASSTTTPSSMADPFAQTFTAPDQNIIIETIDTHTKKLIIESIHHEHRGHYACMADNGITERTRKIIFIRVKDKLVALWPFLGIVAELFILFTIIHIWETQRAYKEVRSTPPTSVASPISVHGGAVMAAGTASNKRPAVGVGAGFESVPLTST